MAGIFNLDPVVKELTDKFNALEEKTASDIQNLEAKSQVDIKADIQELITALNNATTQITTAIQPFAALADKINKLLV